MKKIFFVLGWLLIINMGCIREFGMYKRHEYTRGGNTLPYRVLLPENYDASKKYPLIFFLHGAGERGDDNEKQLLHGARLFLKVDVREKYPVIVVFPQCSENSFWSNVKISKDEDKNIFAFKEGKEPTIAMKLAQELLNKIIKEYPVAKDQIYAVGLSMGGMGTFEIVGRNPGLFAAAIPICGGGATAAAGKLTKTKWWVFHGAKDDVVAPQYSEEMVKALQDANAQVRFTLYPEADHNSWDPAFEEPDFLSWLLSQHK